MTVLENGWWEYQELFLGVCPCRQVSIVCGSDVDKGVVVLEWLLVFGVQDVG